MTITDFLLARIADDESALREYLDPGITARSVSDGMVVLTDASGNEQVMTEDSLLDGYLHDPRGRRALADCTAKRQLVRLHHVLVNAGVRLAASTGEPLPDRCAECIKPAAWPCRTLRVLATVYADHADYREEWRRL